LAAVKRYAAADNQPMNAAWIETVLDPHPLP
jgi:hypothetical protein